MRSAIIAGVTVVVAALAGVGIASASSPVTTLGPGTYLLPPGSTVVVPNATASPSPSPTAPPVAALGWPSFTIANSSVANVSSAGPAVARAAFDRANVRISAPVTNTGTFIAAGWTSVPTLNVKSFAALQSEIASLPAGKYRVIEYDPENWSYTPLVEQQNVCQYAALFGALAHQYGYVAEEDPATDLGNAVSHPGMTNEQWFISADIAGCVAKSVDIFDRQAQSLEQSTSAYATDLTTTSAQALTANPRVQVLADLSASLGTTEVPAAQLYADARAVEPFVGGFFLNVNGASGSAPTAVTFLQDLGF